jgi:hypothetical protein
MNRILVTLAALYVLGGTAALAQTSPTLPPSDRAPTAPAITAPPPAAVPARPPAGGGAGETLTLSEEQARSWIDKVVYSSDDKSLGDVAAIQRDSTGKVTELHADVGGFLGLGSTRVRVMPSQFKLEGDRVVLKLKADEIKSLPKVGPAR